MISVKIFGGANTSHYEDFEINSENRIDLDYQFLTFYRRGKPYERYTLLKLHSIYRSSRSRDNLNQRIINIEAVTTNKGEPFSRKIIQIAISNKLNLSLKIVREATYMGVEEIFHIKNGAIVETEPYDGAINFAAGDIFEGLPSNFQIQWPTISNLSLCQVGWPKKDFCQFRMHIGGFSQKEGDRTLEKITLEFFATYY